MYLIAVDFDGVLHAYDSGFKGIGVAVDDPIAGALARLERMQDHVQMVPYIFTTHGATPEGIIGVRNWLLKHGYPYEKAMRLEITNIKRPAHMYIDDRAWQFDGTFPTDDEILNFKTWQRRK